MTTRRTTVLPVFALVMLLVAVVRPIAAQSSSVSRLAWISGCWQGRSPTRGTVIDEQWMTPRAGTMLGMSRTVRGDSVVTEFEHLRITSHGAGATYHAEPSGQPPADFTAARVSDTLVVFENLTHDFPQRVIYRRRGADSLLARIEGTVGGRGRAVDFPYARVPCP